MILLSSPREMVTELYWTALSRAPNELETKAALAHLEQCKQLRVGLEDLTWSLLNAKEFLLPPLVLAVIYGAYGYLATPPELGRNFESALCLVLMI